MKKITFYQSMAASYAAAVALAVALSAGLSACDKDEDNGSDAEPYKPSKGMTHEQILVLFKEVNDNMATVRQVSVERTRITEDRTENGRTTTSTSTVQVDLDAKKKLTYVKYDDGVLGRFTYTEDNIAYEYDDGNYNTPQRSYKVSDAYWNRSEDYSDFGDITESVSEWKVKDDAFVGSATEDGETREYTVFLTSSNKISNVKYEYEYSNTEYIYREYKYTYSANPTFPSSYKKSDFPLVKQYSVKVVWGGSLGESTFYSEWYNDTYAVDPEEIVDYAPKVAGKKPTLYSDKAFINAIYSIIYLRDNNTVIYVKWVDDSGSTSKSKSKPAAKSRLFR